MPEEYDGCGHPAHESQEGDKTRILHICKRSRTKPQGNSSITYCCRHHPSRALCHLRHVALQFGGPTVFDKSPDSLTPLYEVIQVTIMSSITRTHPTAASGRVARDPLRIDQNKKR